MFIRLILQRIFFARGVDTSFVYGHLGDGEPIVKPDCKKVGFLFLLGLISAVLLVRKKIQTKVSGCVTIKCDVQF